MRGDFLPRGQDVIDDVWIEDQVILPRSKAPPNDIVKLAQGAGRWAGRYDALAIDVHFVMPNTWKGGPVPKRISHPRIKATLSAAERAIVTAACAGHAPSVQHNILDAVGIGVWVRKQVHK